MENNINIYRDKDGKKYLKIPDEDGLNKYVPVSVIQESLSSINIIEFLKIRKDNK